MRSGGTDIPLLAEQLRDSNLQTTQVEIPVAHVEIPDASAAPVEIVSGEVQPVETVVPIVNDAKPVEIKAQEVVSVEEVGVETVPVVSPAETVAIGGADPI